MNHVVSETSVSIDPETLSLEFTERGETMLFELPKYDHLRYTKVLATLEGEIGGYEPIARYVVMELKNDVGAVHLFHHVVVLDMMTNSTYKLIIPKMYGFDIDSVEMKESGCNPSRDDATYIEISIRHLHDGVSVIDNFNVVKEVITTSTIYLTE